MGLCEGGRNQQILDGNDLIWLQIPVNRIPEESRLPSFALRRLLRAKKTTFGLDEEDAWRFFDRLRN